MHFAEQERILRKRDPITLVKELNAVEARLAAWPAHRQNGVIFKGQAQRRAAVLARLGHLGARLNRAG